MQVITSFSCSLAITRSNLFGLHLGREALQNPFTLNIVYAFCSIGSNNELFFLCFIFTGNKVWILKKQSFAVSKTSPQNISKFWCKCDKNFTGEVFQKILIHQVFLPLKGSSYTSNSASLDVTWLFSVAETTENFVSDHIYVQLQLAF